MMKKIVELLVDMDGIDFEGEVDIMSLVEKPAIGIDWLAFSEEECEECFDDLEDACKPGYKAIGLKPKGGRMVPNCVPVEAEEQFESYTDYPKSVSEAAARGIKLNEAINNKCATQVGKVRAQQLANGEPISEETIRRMYSYLSRAEVYYDANDTEACGTISFLLWGSYPALKWSERKIAQIEKEKEEMALLQVADNYGEDLDVMAGDIYLDMTQQEFSTLEDIAKAVSVLDVLGKRGVKKDEPAQQRFRYAGPKDGNTRGFCRKMLSMNKLYTLEDLRAMETDLSRYGARRGSQNYSVLEFKSGVNCRHAWHSVQLFKQESGRVAVLDMGPVRQGNVVEEVAAKMTARELNNAGKQAGPDNNWWSQQANYRMGAQEHMFEVVSEDQQIIVGPAMVPQKLIPRKDEDGNIFYVYFSKETIKNISEKFMAKGYLHNTDVNHDMDITQENTLLESWIIEDTEFDKSKKYGYDLPEGTWMVSYKVNNPDTWEMIKEGKLNGYSIAGTFLERLAR